MRATDALWDTLYDPVAVEFLDLSSAEDILDVGCGSGMWTGTLLRLQRRAMMVGLDSDRGALSLASKNLGAKVDLVLADASSLPFKEGCFDLVTCRRLLINLRPGQRSKAIREMIRVAKVHRTVSSVEPSLHVEPATHFSTLKGSLRFSRRLEVLFPGTDFSLGPRVINLFLREGLEDVKVRGYLSIHAALPPDYDNAILNSVVHKGFKEALTELPEPSKAGTGKSLRNEASRLDLEMKGQKRRGQFASLSAIPIFITKGTKPLPD